MNLKNFILDQAKNNDINAEEINILNFAKMIIDNNFSTKEKCVKDLYNDISELQKWKKINFTEKRCIFCKHLNIFDGNCLITKKPADLIVSCEKFEPIKIWIRTKD